MQPISSVPAEEELLVKRKTKYKVVGWAESKHGVGAKYHKQIVVLDEVSGTIPDTQDPPPELDATTLYNTFKKHSKEGYKFE